MVAVNTEVDIDLADVRSRITDLHAESISLATDLLAVLGPLQRYVTEAIDRTADVEVIELTREPAVAPASRTFDDDERAVLELHRFDERDRFVLDLSHIAG